MPNARERIEKVISENPVVLFMKGTPEFPQCGFSGQVIQILDYLGAPVVGVNVLEDADIRQGIKEYANWPTIPQLYVKGEFVGGGDITREMFQSGELAAMFTDAGVQLKSQAGPYLLGRVSPQPPFRRAAGAGRHLPRRFALRFPPGKPASTRTYAHHRMSHSSSAGR